MRRALAGLLRAAALAVAPADEAPRIIPYVVGFQRDPSGEKDSSAGIWKSRYGGYYYKIWDRWGKVVASGWASNDHLARKKLESEREILWGE